MHRIYSKTNFAASHFEVVFQARYITLGFLEARRS